MMEIYRMISEYLSDFGIGQITIRAILAIIVGCLIGAERAKHGRAAGMRTHILVCLGAAMTSMTSLYVSEVLNYGGDVLRIPAQVISGIGFLGAGMIILKNNNTIVGLTTAAGIWATATIGIAIGYGFCIGAVIVAILLMLSVNLFARMERHRKNAEIIYIEIDDMHKTNEIIARLRETLNMPFNVQVLPPKSGFQGHLGLGLTFEKKAELEFSKISVIEHVVYIAEE
ncbi:MAG: MgtC/SapB family protein [Clostridia bacterium]|nr:MgtC/SapB family protein [Clostridia bacterium]